MSHFNQPDMYSRPARFFHWAIAFLVLGMIPVGLFMTGMENSPLQFQVYALHKSIGLVVLFLGVGRIIWRLVSPPPEGLYSHKPWEKALAGMAHFWLYVCVIGMPLSGWLMSSAAEFPVPFFGLQFPHLIGKDEGLFALFARIHEILAYTLLFVLALHVAGALKHHVIDRDETLQRMSFARAGIGLAALIVLVVGLSYAVSGLSLWKKGEKEPGAIAVSHTAREAHSGAMPLTDHLPPYGWAIVPDKGTLTFRATMYGGAFQGRFDTLDGEIVFNPDDLENAFADIRIGMGEVVTGDADRDSSITGAGWFNAAQYPESRFKTLVFERTGDGGYIAVGELTIRDVSLPVTLPFTLDIRGDEARMKGEVRLNRLDFGIGTDEWADDATVGHEVIVNIDLLAVR